MAGSAGLAPALHGGEQSRTWTLDVCLATLCLLAMCMQEVALARDQYVNKVYRRPTDTVWRGAVLLVPLAIGSLFIVGGQRLASHPPGWQLILYLFGATTGASLLMSFEHCLEAKNRFADFLRYAPPWIMLFVAYHAFSSIRRRYGLLALLKWYDRFAMIAAADALITAGYGGIFYGYHISNFFYIFLIGWAVLNDRISELTTHVVLGGALVTTVLSGKRTNFVLVAIAIGGAIVIRLVRGGKVMKFAFSLLGMAVAGVAAQFAIATYSGGETLTDIAFRVFANINEIVVEQNHDNSYRYRIHEVENVKLHLKNCPEDIVFGVGFGGEVPMVYDTGPTAATIHGNMRHVHKGYWLYLLRHGICGLMLLATFVVTSTVVLYRSSTRVPLVTSACALYALGRVVASFGGNLMMEDLDLPLAVALGFAATDAPSWNTTSMLSHSRNMANPPAGASSHRGMR